ncbi:hypothetical protein [Nonomuraea dietziae]|uniref:hypothetical protein n=1 Tax=Nonomuraea dietziae TaxID=65515 RepID=UPI003448C2A5
MGEVLSVLDEAAQWLNTRGISQWPARFEAAWVEEAILRGETWLVTAGDKVAGTVTMDWSDPLWTDADAAGYVHRMAVRRWASGLGVCEFSTGQPMPHSSGPPSTCGWPA